MMTFLRLAPFIASFTLLLFIIFAAPAGRAMRSEMSEAERTALPTTLKDVKMGPAYRRVWRSRKARPWVIAMLISFFATVAISLATIVIVLAHMISNGPAK